MSNVIILWSAMAGFSLVLAGIHGEIWLRNRTAAASGAFALICLCVVVVDLVELSMMHADSMQSYLQLIRALYVAILAGFIALISFVRIYMRAGRRWLGWASIGMRALATVAGLSLPNSLHFTELHTLEPASFLGSQVMIAQGTPNPWLATAILSNLLLTAFFVDAIVTAWKQRGGRQVILLGSALLFLVLSGFVSAALISLGLLKAPLHVTSSFFPIIAIMGWRLSQDLVHSAQLGRDLIDAESRLLASRQRMMLAAEAAKVGFWTLDPGTMRFHGTTWAMRLFGMYGDESPDFARLLTAMHPADRDNVRGALADALRSTELVSVEYRSLGTDGRMRWYLSAVGGRYSGSGASLRLMGVTFDITDRKQAEEAVSRQRNEAEHLSRVVTVSGLSDMLAHELRQPLDSILTDARSARSRLQGTSVNREGIRLLLADIVAMNDRASRVISKLRNLLRRSDPVREHLALCTLVDGVLDFLKPDLSRRGVQVVTELDRSMRALSADRIRLEQVFIKIILNACDAMAARPRAQRRLFIRTFAFGPDARLEVSDRSGASSVGADTLSDPFLTNQVSGGATELAICRAIVESHGGQIRVDASDGDGYCFLVRLPFSEFDN